MKKEQLTPAGDIWLKLTIEVTTLQQDGVIAGEVAEGDPSVKDGDDTNAPNNIVSRQRISSSSKK